MRESEKADTVGLSCILDRASIRLSGFHVFWLSGFLLFDLKPPRMVIRGGIARRLHKPRLWFETQNTGPAIR